MTVPLFTAPAPVNGQSAPVPAPIPLCPCGCGFTAVSAAKLDSSAIPHGIAPALGITPLFHVPEAFATQANMVTPPGMLFEGTEDSGARTQCVKPDAPFLHHTGRPVKYVNESDNGAPMWRLRDPSPTGPELVIEGMLQSRAVARWAPDGMGVTGLNGCRGWSGRDLSFAKGREVVVFLDKDRETNAHVRDAAMGLEDELWDQGATGVRFVTLPHDPLAAPTDGPDDYLGRLPEDRRGAFVGALVSGAALLSRPDVEAFEARLLTTDELDGIPQPEPLIPGYLTKDSLARLVGEPGTGKSFVALEWAAAVGTGGMYAGKPAVRGSVLYVVAEGASGIGKRVRAWEKHNKRKMEGVQFFPAPVQIMGSGDGTRDKDWKALVSVARRTRPSLIVLDTQSRVTVGVEENSNTEMGKVVDRLESLRTQSGACVLLVHHTAKGGDTGRGAGVVTGALTTEFMLTRQGEGEEKTLKLENTKEKDEADGLCRYLRMQVEYLTEGDPENPFDQIVSSVVLVEAEPDEGNRALEQETERRIPERESEFRERMDKLFADGPGATKAEIKDMAIKGDVKEGLLPIMSKATFHRLWSSLHGLGLVAQVGTTQKFKVAPPGMSSTEFSARISHEMEAGDDA